MQARIEQAKYYFIIFAKKKMNSNNIISHVGTVIAIEKEKILVHIQSHSACGSCHSKSLCHIAGTDKKIIEINTNQELPYSIGEVVTVKTSLSTGNKAVLLAYGIPIIVLFTALFGSFYFLKNESLAGVVAIVTTGLYYFILWLLRDKIKNKIIFYIEKQNT